MTPSPAFSPADGAVLAEKSTVYLFVPRGYGGALPQPIERGLEVDGASFVAREVGASASYHVVRLDLVAAKPALTIRWRPQLGVDSVVAYQIGTPATAMATVTDVTHRKFAWSCSHQDTIDITLTGSAIAYRLDWADATSTLLLPSWNAPSELDEGKPVESNHTVEIGHQSCQGHNVDPDQLATLRAFRLVALFSDGSEQRVGSARMQRAAHDVRLPRELMDPEPAFDGARAPTRCAHASGQDSRIAMVAPCRRGWAMPTALAGLAVIAAGVAVALRRRRNHLPRY